MIPNDKKSALVSIYLYICDLYESELKYECQRYSNNSKPEFTDQEIMTIYLFTTSQQHYYKAKEIHAFAKDYLFSWFPLLPSYQQFNNRLVALGNAFRHLSVNITERFIPDDCDKGVSLVDSLPIVTCKGRNRKGKVARELADKGFCSTKGMYYYGLKLHALGFRRKGRIPFPEHLLFTPASVNDMEGFRQGLGDMLHDRIIFADKGYCDIDLNALEQTDNLTLLTPVKLVKGETDAIRLREQAYRDVFSKAVSAVRQPIESFFNWLIEKTGIQSAQKVRSTKGLLLHIFGRIAAAFIFLIF